MSKELTAEDRVRAQGDAWREGYDVHIGCGGEYIDAVIVEGKSAAQVSRESGIGVGTIRSRVAAAKREGGHTVQTSAGTRRKEGLGEG